MPLPPACRKCRKASLEAVLSMLMTACPVIDQTVSSRVANVQLPRQQDFSCSARLWQAGIPQYSAIQCTPWYGALQQA